MSVHIFFCMKFNHLHLNKTTLLKSETYLFRGFVEGDLFLQKGKTCAAKEVKFGLQAKFISKEIIQLVNYHAFYYVLMRKFFTKGSIVNF